MLSQLLPGNKSGEMGGVMVGNNILFVKRLHVSVPKHRIMEQDIKLL